MDGCLMPTEAGNLTKRLYFVLQNASIWGEKCYSRTGLTLCTIFKKSCPFGSFPSSILGRKQTERDRVSSEREGWMCSDTGRKGAEQQDGCGTGSWASI